eukprot:364466-Chlamydomonas_euryale.AAC.11
MPRGRRLRDVYGHASQRPRAGPGLGRHEWPRRAASTHVLCTDHPASVSHKGERSGPPKHILPACMSPFMNVR